MTTGRYARQTGLMGFGEEAQRKLAASSVLIIGAGGLGVPAATYLAAMGVGRIGIVDDDRVAESNLHRQVAYTPADVGELKVEVLSRRLRAQNPDVQVDAHALRLSLEAVPAVAFAEYGLVLDASDNFSTRYLVNDLCVAYGTPLVYGATQGFEGQVAVFNLREGSPTYRCLFPESADSDNIPSCAVGGVLGVLPGIIGNLQALEAVKVLAGVGEPLDGRVYVFDGLAGLHMTLTVGADAANARISLDELHQRHAEPRQASTQALRERLRVGELVIDVRSAAECAADPVPGTNHVPLPSFDTWLTTYGISLKGDVYFLCASGKRSLDAARRFNRHTHSARGVSVAGGARALWLSAVEEYARQLSQ